MEKWVTVKYSNVKGKAIVSNENQLYIIPAMGYYNGQEIVINISKAVKAPSLLYAIAMIYDEDMTEAVEFIKENW